MTSALDISQESDNRFPALSDTDAIVLEAPLSVSTDPIIPQLLKEGSAEFKTYVDSLVSYGQTKNSKYLCPSCWCKLSYLQKNSHHPAHINSCKTPLQYCDMGGFTTYAKSYGHAHEFDNIFYYERIKEKPLACMQIKKPKSNTIDPDTTEKITISLNGTPPQISLAQVTPKNPSQKQTFIQVISTFFVIIFLDKKRR